MAKKTKRRAKKTATKKARASAKTSKRKVKKTKTRKSAKRATAKKSPKARRPVRNARLIPTPEQLAPSGVPEFVSSALEEE